MKAIMDTLTFGCQPVDRRALSDGSIHYSGAMPGNADDARAFIIEYITPDAACVFARDGIEVPPTFGATRLMFTETAPDAVSFEVVFRKDRVR